MEPANTGAHERPVFVFTMHRSGGTLLARLLNAHPDIVIWGEHGGWINKLAEADSTLAYIPAVLRPVEERGLEAYASGEGIGNFAPWASPFELRDFRKFSRDLIYSVFSRETQSHQRWGFKEIRYHQPATAKFLAELFPLASFILLRRDPVNIVTSSVMAPWPTMDPTLFRIQHSVSLGNVYTLARAIFDCAYAVAVMEAGFGAIEQMLSGRCLVLEYQHLKDSVGDMLKFLSLNDSEPVRQHMSAVLQVRTGESPRISKKRRILMETLATWGLNRAAKRLADHGVDWGRLKRLKGRNYSYVVGDHYLAHTPLSSMF